jgi:hypothetical protein
MFQKAIPMSQSRNSFPHWCLVALLGGMLLFPACSGKEAASNLESGTPAAEEVEEGEYENAHDEDRDARELSPAAEADFSPFVPAGHEIMDKAIGDLDLDGREDALLVLKVENEPDPFSMEEGEEAPGRPLLILTRQANGDWELEGRNDDVVLRMDEGGVFGDPYSGLAIKNGYFSVEHYGGSAWRWTHIVTFKHDAGKQGWFLHKVGGESFHTSEPENTEEHVKGTKDFGVVAFKDYAADDFR